MELEQILSLMKLIFRASHAAISFRIGNVHWRQVHPVMPQDDLDRLWALHGCASHMNTIPSLDCAIRDPQSCEASRGAGAAGIRSSLGVPLEFSDESGTGVLCVFGMEPRHFAPHEIELLGKFAKLVKSQLELRLTAAIDGLTGVLTRRAFVSRLERAAAMVHAEPASLVLIDLDHFKTINDKFGHPTGDAVLARVADTIGELEGASGSVGRLGGEEFGVLLHGATAEDAWNFAQRLESRIARISISEIGDHPLTASVGVAECQRTENRSSWFARTDRALYAAKHAGRNQVVMAETAQQSVMLH